MDGSRSPSRSSSRSFHAKKSPSINKRPSNLKPRRMPKLLSVEELQGLTPKEIPKEPREEFENRKINLEMAAVREERDRIDRERRGKFNERDFEFGGEIDLQVPKYKEDWDEGLEFKSGTDPLKALIMRGWASVNPEMKIFYKIENEQKPIMFEHFTYVKIKKNKLMIPYLYKLTRKSKIREVRAETKSMSEIDAKTLLTKGDIEKRAELFAKVFLRYNLDKVLEEEDRKKAEEERERQILLEEQRLEEEKKHEEEEKAKDLAKKKASDSDDYSPRMKGLTENEREEVIRRRTIATRKATNMGTVNPIVEEEEEKPKKKKLSSYLNDDDYSSNDQPTTKHKQSRVSVSGWDREKHEATEKVFKEIIDFIDKMIIQGYEEGDMDKCMFYREKKEEMENSMNDNRDPDSFLRTLLIFKINNYY